MCTKADHDSIKATDAAWLRETIAQGQWFAPGFEAPIELGRCRTCGSTLARPLGHSDGVAGDAVREHQSHAELAAKAC